MPRYFISLHPIRFVSIFSVCVAVLTIIFSPVNGALADSSPPAGGDYYQGMVIGYQISECYDAPSYCQNLIGVNWQTAQTLVPQDIAAVMSHIGLGTDEPPWIYYGTWTCQNESPWKWWGFVGPVGSPPRDAWFYMPSGYWFKCTSSGVNAPSPTWLVGAVYIGCRPKDKLSYKYPGWCEGPAKYEVSFLPSAVYIPLYSNVDSKDHHVLTEDALALNLTKNDNPVPGVVVPLKSSRGKVDTISGEHGTNDYGDDVAFISTRQQPGTSTITSASSTIETAAPADISWLPATYEGKFLVTCYAVANEQHQTGGPMVTIPGLPGKYHEQFYKQTRIQGTGLLSNPPIPTRPYIHTDVKKHGKYNYFACPLTARGDCAKAGKTIAVDPSIIPMHRHPAVYADVSISGVGDRTSEDGGSWVNGYHIDWYFGPTWKDYYNCINHWGRGGGYVHTVTLNSYVH